MLKNIALIISIGLVSTAACAKTSVETKAADDSTVESKNTAAENSEAEKSGEQTSEKASEKAIADNAKIFRGMINGAAFEMRLVRDGGKLSGTYFYTKVGKDLTLSGTIDAGGKFNLKETDGNGKATGKWSGTWKEAANDNGIALEGTWSKPNENVENGFSFYATEQIVELTNGAKLVDKTTRETDKAKRSEIHSVYPELAGVNSAAAKKFNETVKNLVVAANDAYRRSLADFTAEDVKNLPDGVNLSNEVGYDVALANDDLISLIFSNYTYEGGAHGNTSSATVNYDLKNNRELNLADVFEPNSNYLKIISDYAIADLKSRVGDLSDDEWLGKGAAATAENFSSWNLTKKGLLITFDQYQVAAYAAGPQTVIVPYEKLKSVLRKDVAWASLLK